MPTSMFSITNFREVLSQFPFFFMFFFCCNCDCMVGLPLFPSTMFVHPLALGDTLGEIGSIDFLCDRLWETRFIGILCVRFWNTISINILYSDGGFQDVASPLFIVAHSRAFEALHGKFWTNKLMVGQCTKLIYDVSTSHVHFHCGYKQVLHSHQQLWNNMVLRKGYLEDENSFKLIWNLTWVKHLKWTIVVAGWSHLQKE